MTDRIIEKAAWNVGEYLNHKYECLLEGKRYYVCCFSDYSNKIKLFELRCGIEGTYYSTVVMGEYSPSETTAVKSFIESCAKKFGFSTKELIMKMYICGFLK